MLMLVCILWLDAVVFRPEPNPRYSSRLKDCNLVCPQRLNHWSLTICSVERLQYKAHPQWKNCLDTQPGALKIIALSSLSSLVNARMLLWSLPAHRLDDQREFSEQVLIISTCCTCVCSFKWWVLSINLASRAVSACFGFFFTFVFKINRSNRLFMHKSISTTWFFFF